MSLDSSTLEARLKDLTAAELDDALLARLDACAHETWTELSPAETAAEREFQRISPTDLPGGLLESLVAATAAVPFPRGEANILPFPERPVAAPRRKERAWWGAAAAVALCGALAALMIPQGADRPVVSGGGSAPQPPPAPADSPRQGDRLIPAGFDRGLSEARDAGVVWPSNQQPHRVLKVVYKDRVTLRDGAGRTYQVEQPRVEYILVPDKAD